MNLQTKSYALVAVGCALIILSGCGSDDSGPTGGGGTDTTPPSVSNVSAVDSSHINITFSEALARTEAEKNHYTIVESGTPSPTSKQGATAPGDPLVVFSAALRTDQKTVTLTTNPMAAVGYTLTVSGVTDVHGNEVETPIDKVFTGSTASDVTAPEVVYRFPAPGATGVAVGASLEIDFSEPVNSFAIAYNLSSLDGTPVPVNMSTGDDVHFTIHPTSPLELNTAYTDSLRIVSDAHGNVMPLRTWTFRTANAADTTPPTLVSSIPPNNAVNVDINTSLSLTFAEVMDQNTSRSTSPSEPCSSMATKATPAFRSRYRFALPR